MAEVTVKHSRLEIHESKFSFLSPTLCAHTHTHFYHSRGGGSSSRRVPRIPPFPLSLSLLHVPSTANNQNRRTTSSWMAIDGTGEQLKDSSPAVAHAHRRKVVHHSSGGPFTSRFAFFSFNDLVSFRFLFCFLIFCYDFILNRFLRSEARRNTDGIELAGRSVCRSNSVLYTKL